MAITSNRCQQQDRKHGIFLLWYSRRFFPGPSCIFLQEIIFWSPGKKNILFFKLSIKILNLSNFYRCLTVMKWKMRPLLNILPSASCWATATKSFKRLKVALFVKAKVFFGSLCSLFSFLHFINYI